ncbi:isochorismate synthase [Actinomadura roseirufa]|uniref:isochorismate synthase n=1 Tax=Actinomadura roseirufa TaxID=2094049 RepID=UPI0013F16F9B|nr:isochorismate synthase [Actinomadura roseirufa]
MAPARDAESDPARLLAQYRAGTSFYFSSPPRVLLTLGRRADIAAMGVPAALPAAVAGALDAAPPGSVVVGALPFRWDLPPRLHVPAKAQWAVPLRPPRRVAAALASEAVVRAVPEPEEYERAVREALTRLARRDGLGKVVLARVLEVTLARRVDSTRLLRNLAARDSHGHVFAAPLDGRTLMGASPELLVSRRGRRVTSRPLAGSAARSADPFEDRRRAARLLESAKDLAEHAFVVRAVRDALRPYCDRLTVPARPSLVGTATMWHLGTHVTGRLCDPPASALALAVALHPTPAVCGTPAAAARDVIAELEPFERGYYGGAVGWCDAEGDGDWAVAIRCAEVGDRSLRLFAGAGIVPGSDPAAELAETAAKFQTMLRALGLDDLDGRGDATGSDPLAGRSRRAVQEGGPLARRDPRGPALPGRRGTW